MAGLLEVSNKYIAVNLKQKKYNDLARLMEIPVLVIAVKHEIKLTTLSLLTLKWNKKKLWKI